MYKYKEINTGGLLFPTPCAGRQSLVTPNEARFSLLTRSFSRAHPHYFVNVYVLKCFVHHALALTCLCARAHLQIFDQRSRSLLTLTPHARSCSCSIHTHLYLLHIYVHIHVHIVYTYMHIHICFSILMYVLLALCTHICFSCTRMCICSLCFPAH